MNTGKTLFNQLMSFASQYQFKKCISKYADGHEPRSFSYWDQFLTMAFAQVTHRESLRDIEASLRATDTSQYHLGIRGRVSRSTLADANEKRDWRIFAEFGKILMQEAQRVYEKDRSFQLELEQAVYAMDSTNIELCLSLFPWASFSQGVQDRAGIRIDTVLNLRGNLPCFIDVATRKSSELTAIDQLSIVPGSIYIFDRGYFDWSRLNRFAQAQAFFVLRAKKDIKYKRQYSSPVQNRSTGVKSDQVILPYSPRARRDYPGALRRVTFYDITSDVRFAFLTNNFLLPPEIVAALYKQRWQIELFFKWLKQHLQIKAFYGTSFNAIKIQIWVAVSTFLLFAIAKRQLNLPGNLYTFSQTFSVAALLKMPISSAFQRDPSETGDNCCVDSQFQPNLWPFPTGQ